MKKTFLLIFSELFSSLFVLTACSKSGNETTAKGESFSCSNSACCRSIRCNKIKKKKESKR